MINAQLKPIRNQEDYEDKHCEIDVPDPNTALKFRIEQARLTQRDLVPLPGTRSKVSDVLSGKHHTPSFSKRLHASVSSMKVHELHETSWLNTGLSLRSYHISNRPIRMEPRSSPRTVDRSSD